MSKAKRIVLTGFMGAGKSTVAKCLSYILQIEKIDLDRFIEAKTGRAVPEIIGADGEADFRRLETVYLRELLAQTRTPIISLGGGTWVSAGNREIIKRHGCTSVWLESTFEHCWRNISFSKQNRPLAKNKELAEKLFYERQKFYCLADWHFVVRPDFTSFEVARKIAEEVFG